MKKVVIISYCRTPIGRFRSMLSQVPLNILGSTVIDGLLMKSKVDPKLIDEVIMGNVLSAGKGQNPARNAVLNSRLSCDVPATPLNTVCGSGLKSIQMAVSLIQTGNCDVVIAGGMESMSTAEHIISLREEKKFGDFEIKDSILVDGLTVAKDGYHMGITAEIIAEKYSITRETADEFAINSHSKYENNKKSMKTKLLKSVIMINCIKTMK